MLTSLAKATGVSFGRDSRTIPAGNSWKRPGFPQHWLDLVDKLLVRRGETMLTTEQERLKQDIATWVERFGCERGSLLPVLQEIQKKHRHVSGLAMQLVADHLGIHPAEVHSVMSFYAFLDDRPKGQFVIRLCQTISCDMAGKQRIARQLMNELGIKFGETTRDGKFTLEWANCIGMCDQGPALLVNDAVYTRVTPAMVHDIVETCRQAFGLHTLGAKGEGHA
jgi:NADH:ubiquinone oxidoreductase subunit E